MWCGSSYFPFYISFTGAGDDARPFSLDLCSGHGLAAGAFGADRLGGLSGSGRAEHLDRAAHRSDEDPAGAVVLHAPFARHLLVAERGAAWVFHARPDVGTDHERLPGAESLHRTNAAGAGG